MKPVAAAPAAFPKRSCVVCYSGTCYKSGCTVPSIARDGAREDIAVYPGTIKSCTIYWGVDVRTDFRLWCAALGNSTENTMEFPRYSARSAIASNTARNQHP